MNSLHFEPLTGVLYADPEAVGQAEAGTGPRNLIQLQRAGRLMVGNVECLDEAYPDILPLSEILDVQTSGRVAGGVYEHLDAREWEREDFVGYGQWLDAATRDPAKPTTQLTQTVLVQAYNLGIGASESLIRRGGRGFSSLGDFYDAAGLVPRHRKGAFDSWTDEDLADYAERVLIDLLDEAMGQTGLVDLNGEINRRAQEGQGPSCEIYRRDGGWPMKYLAPRGYADLQSMGPDEYVQWGLNFMIANGGQVPTRRAINFLAKSRRSPEYQAFTDRFRMADYKALIIAAYEAHLAGEAEEGEASNVHEKTTNGANGHLPAMGEQALKHLQVPEELLASKRWATSGQLTTFHQALI